MGFLHLNPIVSMTSASKFRKEINATKKYKASSSTVPVGSETASWKARMPLDGNSKETSRSLDSVSDFKGE
jgi:hypothetical protein